MMGIIQVALTGEDQALRDTDGTFYDLKDYLELWSGLILDMILEFHEYFFQHGI